MFCKNCGQQIPDTAKFCGKCGAVTSNEPNVNEISNQNVNNQYVNNPDTSNPNMNGQNVNNPNMNNQYANNPNMNHQHINNPYANNFDFTKIINEITYEFISLVKNPIATVRESKNKDNNSYMILGLLASLLAILNSYILKSSILNTNIYKFILYFLSVDNTDKILDGNNFAMIMKLLISNLALIGIVSAVIFLIVNVMMKKVNFTYFDGLKVAIAGYVYSTIISFIGAIVSYISIPFGIAIMLISLITYMILIYEGLTSFGYIDKNKCLYIVIITMAVIIISQYFIVTMQIKNDCKDVIDQFKDGYEYFKTIKKIW